MKRVTQSWRSFMSETYNGYILVKFIGNSKEFSFGTNELTYKIDEKVVVETKNGLELAIVSKEYQPMETIGHSLEVKPVIRVATSEDVATHRRNKIKAFDARMPIEQEIQKHKLDMNLVDVEYTLDQKKIIITYVSEHRVDFRELLKDLTTLFPYPCRVELRQINQRDKAKLVGGIGVCGRNLCCKNHLKSLESVSINMAKNQQLSLNINKLSGQCGKLKCCLRYENDLYTEAKKGLPKINSNITYNDQRYRVSDLNLLNKQITLSNREERLVMSFDEFLGEGQNV